MNKLTLLVILALYALPLHAQTSANVPTQDRAYGWINILVGAKLINSDFPEQRPWSRLEFTRLIREADAHFEQRMAPVPAADIPFKAYAKQTSQKRFIKSILDALHKEFSTELTDNPAIQFVPLEKAQVLYTYLGQNSQLVPNDGLGNTDGLFHPLVNNQEGRHYLKGSNFDLQTQHRIQLSHYLALFARPEVEVTIPNAPYGNSINIYAKTLALKTGWKNVEFEVGRDQVVWNASPNGGLLFSNNPRGQDMTRITTPYPFHLPWILRKIGEFKIDTLFGNLGPQYQPKDPWMTATQIAWHITPNIRISGNHQSTFGGEGTRMVSLKTGILEYFGIPSNGGDPFFGGADTNRGVTLAATFRIPPLRNIQIGFQIYSEDGAYNTIDERQVGQASAYIVNLNIPRLTYDGRLNAYLEYRYVGGLPYQHSTYTSGWALNQEFIALTDGPDTQSMRLNINYQISPYSSFYLNPAYIRRLNNVYVNVVGPDGQIVGTNVVSSGPTEHHFLTNIGGIFNLHNNLQIQARAGLDIIQNAYFTQGQTAHPGVFQLGLTWQK